MKKTRVGMIAGLTLGLAGVTATAWAFGGFTKIFNDTYKVDKDAELAKAKCAVCHQAKDKGDKLNPYGEDLAKVMKDADTKKLTKELLEKVEKLDSDKDKVSNIDEIKADTLPGDAKSKPADKK